MRNHFALLTAPFSWRHKATRKPSKPAKVPTFAARYLGQFLVCRLAARPGESPSIQLSFKGQSPSLRHQAVVLVLQPSSVREQHHSVSSRRNRHEPAVPRDGSVPLLSIHSIYFIFFIVKLSHLFKKEKTLHASVTRVSKGWSQNTSQMSSQKFPQRR